MFPKPIPPACCINKGLKTDFTETLFPKETNMDFTVLFPETGQLSTGNRLGKPELTASCPGKW